MSYNSSYKKNVFANLETTAQSQIANHTSKITVEGSEATYTPDKGSDYVVYELTFLQTYNDNATINVNYYLQSGSIGGSYSNVEGCLSNLGGSNAWSREIKSFNFIIPSWEGAKNLRVVTDTYAVSRDITLHQTKVWNGNYENKKFYPSLIIYSVRNVD